MGFAESLKCNSVATQQVCQSEIKTHTFSSVEMTKGNVTIKLRKASILQLSVTPSMSAFNLQIVSVFFF